MHIDKDAEILFGNSTINSQPFEVFDDRVSLFLDNLSKELRMDKMARNYSDVQTFAFFIRKANTSGLKQRLECNSSTVYRYGRGLVFHIAPSNIPINFAFSWVFGLLSGNANVVKVSSKRFIQTEIVCNAARRVIEKCPEFSFINEKNQIVLYDRDRDDITAYYLSNCDARVIWGGDETIKKIRSFDEKPRCVEIAFADRYSFAVISTEFILSSSEEELKQLCHGFYNDTYLVDQNACSSPQMIFWIGDFYERATDRFFCCLEEECRKYEITEIIASDKYDHLCSMAIDKKIESVKRYGNAIYVYTVSDLDKQIEKYRGKCGEFFCVPLYKNEEISEFINDERIQTCVSVGVDKNEILKCITLKGIKGVDRIVDVGQALDLGAVWDGIDVLQTLSRTIVF